MFGVCGKPFRISRGVSVSTAMIKHCTQRYYSWNNAMAWFVQTVLHKRIHSLENQVPGNIFAWCDANIPSITIVSEIESGRKLAV
ncbi:hypothetical protein LENED_002912 [Lentinula edodes]|uniref:Uncharacterized protein n=1 Tax=Lentinula edodes TaxID=5353 RepID=A0A1Q3E270_LENED|nr:hypothetical protein LENED_002912 [Lentinula edodes]